MAFAHRAEMDFEWFRINALNSVNFRASLALKTILQIVPLARLVIHLMDNHVTLTYLAT
jgi:hypothetical protein